jgi:hypothetical protein
MKRLLTKVFAGLVVIAMLQIPAGNLVESHDFLLRDGLESVVRSAPDVLYLGDSTLLSVAVSEPDPRPLTHLIRERLPGLSIGFVQGPSFGPEMYRDAVGYMLAAGYRPRAIVFPINLRSFSEFWDQMPQFQFSEERLRLRRGDAFALGLCRPLSTYHLFSLLEGYPRSEEEYDRIRVQRGDRMLGTLGLLFKDGHPERRQGDLFSALYLYRLSKDHRKVKALEELASVCRNHGIPLLAYATPVDVETGHRELGVDVRSPLAQNLEIIRGALGIEGGQWRDLVALLGSADFDWNRFPNEHLKSRGRIRLADDVARLIAGNLK